MMKKLISLILVVLCFVLLVGCGSNTTSTPKKEQKVETYDSIYYAKDHIERFLNENPEYHIEMVSAYGDKGCIVVYSK